LILQVVSHFVWVGLKLVLGFFEVKEFTVFNVKLVFKSFVLSA
jgi:hypothetical protein